MTVITIRPEDSASPPAGYLASWESNHVVAPTIGKALDAMLEQIGSVKGMIAVVLHPPGDTDQTSRAAGLVPAG